MKRRRKTKGSKSNRGQQFGSAIIINSSFLFIHFSYRSKRSIRVRMYVVRAGYMVHICADPLILLRLRSYFPFNWCGTTTRHTHTHILTVENQFAPATATFVWQPQTTASNRNIYIKRLTERNDMEMTRGNGPMSQPHISIGEIRIKDFLPFVFLFFFSSLCRFFFFIKNWIVSSLIRCNCFV